MPAPDSRTATAYIGNPHFNTANRTKATIRWIVIHDMESSEGPKTARNVAAYFALPTTRASAHYNVDSTEIIQCVREKDVAWHAPGLSSRSIGVEHAGRASQTAAQWDDTYSRSMLKLSASLFADLCKRYDIPVVFIDAKGLLAGTPGITTHAQVSKAFKKSTHTDPGPNFPVGAFLASIRTAMKT